MLKYCTSGKRNYNSRPIEIHKRHYWEFQIFTKGSCTPIFRNNIHKNLNGNFWVFRPDCPHGWKEPLSKECEIAVFHFSEIPYVLEKQLRNVDALVTSITKNQIAEVLELAEKHSKDVIKPNMLSPLKNRMCLDELSLIFLESNNQLEDTSNISREKQIADIAIAWFCSHMDEGVGIQSIADKMGYDVSHLRRIFHKATGESPNNLLTKHRMIRSAEMLISGNEQIINIGLTCGYNSHSSFTRAFKKYYGVSPVEFRKSNIPHYNEYLESLKNDFKA